MTSFVAHVQDGAVKASKAIVETSKKASAEKVNKAGDDCLYLLACSSKKEAAIDNFKTASIGAKGAKTAKEKAGKTSKAAKRNAPYGEIVAPYASSYEVASSFAHTVISVDSNYRVNDCGSVSEIGLRQIKPTTASIMSYSGSAKSLFNHETNIKFDLKYLAKAHELAGRTTCGAIIRYNAGHVVKRMNPVSVAYCKRVQAIIGR